MTSSFARLTIHGWRQFGSVSIQLDRRLTVLTGANGAGKTTVLNLLGQHLNWQTTFLGTPARNRVGSLSYLQEADDRSGNDPNWLDVGTIEYADESQTQILAPRMIGAAQYNLHIPNLHSFPGVFLQSHRSATSYAALPSIPSTFSTFDQLFSTYHNEILQRYLGSWTGRSAHLVMKESLLAAAVYRRDGDGLQGNAEAEKVWTGFQTVLAALFPDSLGFIRLEARPPEVVVVSNTGEFLLDAVSGGLSALLELAWQIYLRSLNAAEFTVCIDEPENHLHPSLQRQILPNLLNAFPTVYFVVATHSPFVVTSSPESRVYVLDYDDQDHVFSTELDFVTKSESAGDVLEKVLGVSSTLPIWAENRYNEIIARYSSQTPTVDLLRSLRDELVQAGLVDQLPLALESLTSGSFE